MTGQQQRRIQQNMVAQQKAYQKEMAGRIHSLLEELKASLGILGEEQKLYHWRIEGGGKEEYTLLLSRDGGRIVGSWYDDDLGPSVGDEILAKDVSAWLVNAHSIEDCEKEHG